MTVIEDRLAAAPAVAAVRDALAGAADEVWIVGGAIRDALLGRPIVDLDLASRGDPGPLARTIASAASGPSFQLSEAFGAWRAMPRDRAWACDVSSLQGATIHEDLARRDFTVNAMALPLAGGGLLDPHGGVTDLERRTLRVLGAHAYQEDPLRPLRLARLAAELDLEPDDATRRLTAEAATAVSTASPERVFAELRRLVVADRVVEGLDLADRLGLVAAVLPEVDALRGVAQSQFHHLDAYAHTLEVLQRLVALEDSLEEVFGRLAGRLGKVLGEPLADELTRGQALRLGALLHDVGKPATRAVLPTGRVTFIGHDRVGVDIVREACRRLRTSQRLSEYVQKLTLHHLTLGFLVHDRPLSRRAVYRYLTACHPVEVEVTVLTCADRLATRGQNADAAIQAHLSLAAEIMDAALEWRESGPPVVPVRGDELAEELGIRRGPELGRVIAQLREARFAGEIETRDEAIEAARRLRENAPR